MRHALLSWVAWFSALQAIHSPFGFGDDAGRIVGMAGVLGTLTVLVYRLGVWRQQMENARDAVGADVKALREESGANFDRISRRLDAIDHLLSVAADHRARADRRQLRTERRLDRIEEVERVARAQ